MIMDVYRAQWSISSRVSVRGLAETKPKSEVCQAASNCLHSIRDKSEMGLLFSNLFFISPRQVNREHCVEALVVLVNKYE